MSTTCPSCGRPAGCLEAMRWPLVGDERLANALAEVSRLRGELEVTRRDAFNAAVLGLAAIATYGKRDEHGLCGLSKKNYEELGVFHSKYAAISKERQ